MAEGGWLVDDAARLAALAESGMLDATADPRFDAVVTIAAELCAAPVALVTMLDRERQLFKARVGTEETGTPIEAALCVHALGSRELLVIPDLAADPRTQDNALVTGEPHVRFYAGMPLVTAAGHMLGTLCVLDMARRPDGLTMAQREGLADLARDVMAVVEG